MFKWITTVVTSLGYAGVAALALLEHVFPPIPSEIVIPLAGFVAAEGDLRLDLVIAVGTIASLLGGALWYVVGRKVGERRLRAWVDRHGRWLTLSNRDLDRAKDWFDRHGRAAVFFGRLVPGIRTFVSLPAGFSGMPPWAFLLYSALGTAVWTAALAFSGVLLQANYKLVGDYMDIATYTVFGGMGLLLVRRYVNCWRQEH